MTMLPDDQREYRRLSLEAKEFVDKIESRWIVEKANLTAAVVRARIALDARDAVLREAAEALAVVSYCDSQMGDDAIVAKIRALLGEAP